MPTSKPSTPRPESAGGDPAAIFRATFLESLPPESRATLLRQIAPLLQGLAGAPEPADGLAPSGEPPARAGLRAVVADLRHLEGFVTDLTRRCGEDLHPEEDLRIVVIVSKLGGTLGRTAGTLDKALGWRSGATYLEP